MLTELKIMNTLEALLNVSNQLLTMVQVTILTRIQDVIKYNVLKICNQLQLLLLKSIKLLYVREMMKEKTCKYRLDRNSLGMLVALITFINFVLLLQNVPIIAALKVCALLDSACVMKGGLEIIAVSQLKLAVVSLTMVFVSIRVLEVNLLILTRFVDKVVQEDTIKMAKTVPNVTCNALNVMAQRQIIVLLANF